MAFEGGHLLAVGVPQPRRVVRGRGEDAAASGKTPRSDCRTPKVASGPPSASNSRAVSSEDAAENVGAIREHRAIEFVLGCGLLEEPWRRAVAAARTSPCKPRSRRLVTPCSSSGCLVSQAFKGKQVAVRRQIVAGL